jgi:hypothetical protein
MTWVFEAGIYTLMNFKNLLEALTLFCSMLVGYEPLDAIGHLHIMLNGDCILTSLYDNKVCMFESLSSYAFNANLSNKS